MLLLQIVLEKRSFAYQLLDQQFATEYLKKAALLDLMKAVQELRLPSYLEQRPRLKKRSFSPALSELMVVKDSWQQFWEKKVQQRFSL